MERKLMRIKPSKNLIFKEVKAAKSDLEDVVDVVLTSVSSPT
ncbi:MAG: hypothetical protein QMD14_04915 [Candidatus Aenigmarchaeota archaeon]|nr:hypothetical protein [Candidatus Aenigmarchaeota archaeon]